MVARQKLSLVTTFGTHIMLKIIYKQLMGPNATRHNVVSDNQEQQHIVF